MTKGNVMLTGRLAIGAAATYNPRAARVHKLLVQERQLVEAFLEQLSANPNLPSGALEALDVDLRLRSVVALRILLRDPDLGDKVLAELTSMRLKGEDTWT